MCLPLSVAVQLNREGQGFELQCSWQEVGAAEADDVWLYLCIGWLIWTKITNRLAECSGIKMLGSGSVSGKVREVWDDLLTQRSSDPLRRQDREARFHQGAVMCGPRWCVQSCWRKSRKRSRNVLLPLMGPADVSSQTNNPPDLNLSQLCSWLPLLCPRVCHFTSSHSSALLSHPILIRPYLSLHLRSCFLSV